MKPFFCPLLLVLITVVGTIDDPHARVYVPKKVNNMNVKVFNLVSGEHETKILVQHKFCGCKYKYMQLKVEI